MSPQEAADLSEQCHTLNNQFAKILWATELALEEGPRRCVKADLEAIVRLAQAGGELVETLRSVVKTAEARWSG